MATLDKGGTVTLQELIVSSLAQTDAVAKLLIEICDSRQGRGIVSRGGI